jgi:large subunit ribosomal protein L25
MDAVKLDVRLREETGDGPSRRLRAGGEIPGVAYGKGREATPIAIEVEALRAALKHGHNVVLELQFGGAPKKGPGGKQAPLYAVVKEIQMNPTKRQALHIDLHEVDLSEDIEAQVAIELVGTAAGAADGGVLDWVLRDVTVRALPQDVPQSLEVDVSALHIGQHVSVGDLTAPAGVVIVTEPEILIAAVLAPRVEAEIAAAEAPEEEVEPEVIGGAKTEE